MVSEDFDGAFAACADGVVVAAGADGCGESAVGVGAGVGWFVVRTPGVTVGVGVIEGAGRTRSIGSTGCGCPSNAMIAQTVI